MKHGNSPKRTSFRVNRPTWRPQPSLDRLGTYGFELVGVKSKISVQIVTSKNCPDVIKIRWGRLNIGLFPDFFNISIERPFIVDSLLDRHLAWSAQFHASLSLAAITYLDIALTVSENIPSPDNPKTSYLAVLSGIQAVKDFCCRY